MALAVPQKTEQDWAPNSLEQMRFHTSPAYEVLFGGQAGPGKTECLLMESLRQIYHPKYTAILFRRTFTQLEAARGLIHRSQHWFPYYGGKYNAQKHYWTFPSGARIYFAHMQHRKNMYDYDGPEYSYIAFDEVTQFEKEMYLYLFTRARAPSPDLRVYIRAATNPGNIGHGWVKERFITKDIVNKQRWFAMIEDQDMGVERDYPDALSRTFIPATMGSNPDVDPNYRSKILATGDPVRIAQLLEGDWDAEHTEGLVYDNWSATENITAEAEYDPEKPVYWACDDGYVHGDGPGSKNYHPRVVLFMQDNELGGPNIFDEYLATEEAHGSTIEAVLARSYRRPDMAYINGAHATFRGEMTKQSIPTTIGNHRVVEGIRTVRRLIQDGNDVRVLRVHPRCENVIYEMSNYRQDPKHKAVGGEIVPLPQDDHCQEALRHISWVKYRRGN